MISRVRRGAIRMAGAVLLVASLSAISKAGEADVIGVTATPEAGGTWRFDVTVEHADEGWEHYADRWEVLSLDGAVLGVRKLLHPHQTEQPFTRSLTRVEVPEGMDEVEVRARDNVHEWGGATMRVRLER